MQPHILFVNCGLPALVTFGILLSYQARRRPPKTFNATFDSVIEFIECAIDEITSGTRPFPVLIECAEALETVSVEDSAPQTRSEDDTDTDNSAAAVKLMKTEPVQVTLENVFFFVLCIFDEVDTEPGRPALEILSNCVDELRPTPMPLK